MREGCGREEGKELELSVRLRACVVRLDAVRWVRFLFFVAFSFVVFFSAELGCNGARSRRKRDKEGEERRGGRAAS